MRERQELAEAILAPLIVPLSQVQEPAVPEAQEEQLDGQY